MKYDSKEDREILKEIKNDIAVWFDYFSDNITRYREEVEFVVKGKQWEPTVAAEYKNLGKPCLTINKLYSYIQQIAGENRANTADLKVRSIANVSDETLELHENLLRSIAYDSNATIAYQSASECALLGYGVLGISIDYENARSFNQKPAVEAIKDPTTAFFDATAEDVTKSDGDVCGKWTILNRDEFEAKWPKAEILNNGKTGVSLFDRVDIGGGIFKDIKKDQVVVADVWKKKWKKKKIVQLSNKEVVDANEADEIIAAYYVQYATDQYGNYVDNFRPLEIIDERYADDYTINHYKICKSEILEKTEWPSKIMPLVFMDGNSFIIDGKQTTKAFTQFARSSQEYYNFLKSEICHYIKSGRKEQWIGDPECVAGNTEVWANPDRVQGILTAKTIPGKQYPTKVQSLEVPSSLINQQMYIDTEIHTILGIFQSTRGDVGNEISGVAVANKIRQGQSSSYIYRNNCNRAIQQIGKALLSLFPSLYDTERTVFVTDGDKQTKSIIINEGKSYGIKAGEPGFEEGKNSISAEEFDVEIEAGSSYALQKQENIVSMKDAMQVYPDARPYLISDYIKNLDLPNALQLSKTLYDALVPEEIKAKIEKRPPKQQRQPNPMMMAQMQNLQADTQKKQSEAIKNQSQAMKNQADTQIEGIATIDSLMNSHMDRTHENARLDMQNRKIDAEMYKAQTELIDKMITTTEKGV